MSDGGAAVGAAIANGTPIATAADAAAAAKTRPDLRNRVVLITSHQTTGVTAPASDDAEPQPNR